LYKLDWYTPTSNLHRDLSILTIKDVFKLQIAKFVYQHKNGSLPAIFQNYFSTNAQVHRYRTRQANLMHANRPRTSHGAKTIKISGVNIFNGLPRCIIDSPSLNSFKTRVKHHLSSQY
jgi:hypothetical protein